MSSITAPLNTATGGSGSMQTTSADNMQTVKPTGECVFFKAFGRLMHRIGRPAVHVRRCRLNLFVVWWELRSKHRDSDILMKKALQSVSEFFKILLALTGLPRVYRNIDRWRRRHRKPQLDELDSLTQEAVRLYFSHLDVALLPPMSRAVLYGSRTRGDYRDDSDVDIVLVFAGAKPDYDTQVQVCNAMAAAQHQANTALQSNVEVTSFVYWQDEFDEPDKRFNPDFFCNVLADGIDVTFLCAGHTGSEK